MHHDGAGADDVVEGMRAPWDMRRRHSGDEAEKARCGALGQSDVRDGDEADVVPWVGMRRTTMKRRVRKLADSEGVRGYDVAKRWSGYSMGRNEGSRLPSKRLLRKRASWIYVWMVLSERVQGGGESTMCTVLERRCCWEEGGVADGYKGSKDRRIRRVPGVDMRSSEGLRTEGITRNAKASSADEVR